MDPRDTPQVTPHAAPDDTCRTRVPAGLIVLALAIVAMIPGLATAQVSDVEPYYVVVQAEGATLRSGDLRNYYPIAAADVGQILRVDGEGRNWYRVSYPIGVTALVRGDKAELDRQAGVVRLTAPGRPKAWNLEYGVNGSWKDIPTDMLDIGTEFPFVEVATDRNGAAHYVIQAPRVARGFIESAHVRRASQQEIDAYLKSIGGEAALVGAAAARPPAGPAQLPRGAQTPAGSPADATQADLTGIDPVTGEMTVPEIVISQDAAAVRGTPVPPPAPDPNDRPIAALKELDAAFQRVQSQKAIDAELEPLIAEFGAALEQVKPTTENEPLRLALEQRISILEIRQDLQRQLREVSTARSAMDDSTQRVAAAAKEAHATRQYTLVGRLETSAIYDGDRLPLMFRIQSIGEAAPRTLGYIRPNSETDLKGKVGQLVGVIGRAAMDERLKLNIVSPVRVDTLSASGEAEQAAVAGQG